MAGIATLRTRTAAAARATLVCRASLESSNDGEANSQPKNPLSSFPLGVLFAAAPIPFALPFFFGGDGGNGKGGGNGGDGGGDGAGGSAQEVMALADAGEDSDDYAEEEEAEEGGG